MFVCPSCGQENPDGFRFCGACGAALAEEPVRRELRKTVTVVFSDLKGSTAMGEQLDPEAIRQVMNRYFTEMRTILERHGGTVEKFIGDAVMAAFGIPELHEDDALRAVRAAWEMRAAQERLDAEFEARYGARLHVRTGVNTGEVVAGDPAEGQAFATGDAVNVAARLEQAAPPGEILIGAETYRLVRDAVEAEPVEPLVLKGKAEAVPAWRLGAVALWAPGIARRLDSPLVGRERELALLRQAFDRALSTRSCQLATVLGGAGAGKSRVAAEFARSVEGEATVLEGRCLSYGEGITFWPIAEIVKDAAAVDDGDSPEAALAKIAALLPSDDEAGSISERVAAAVGLGESGGTLQETFWAVRRLIEALARDRPLVLVLEDIHWAEEGLLDLIEYVAGWSSGSPIFLICLARQELLEVRPALATPRPNASALLLEPLDREQSGELVENLLGGASLSEQTRGRITAAAEGNPLFVEELLRMLVDDGLLERRNGSWAPTADLSSIAIPATIHALLAARLDRLEAGEHDVIQRASVVGQVFWWGAVDELSPARERLALGGHLQSLVRRELIGPDVSVFAGEDAFRFGHILVREAAYHGMPKEARVDLHERFVGWLEAKAGERAVEYEEIVGYHLEQAFHYRRELRPLDDQGRELGARAGERLAGAGRRALARGDVAAARNLLGRAVELMPDGDPQRVELLIAFGEALRRRGEFGRAGEVLGAAVESAEAAGDRRLEAHARIQRLLLQSDTDPTLGMDEVLQISEIAFPVFEEFGDELGFARTWRATAEVHLTACRWGASAEALERALVHAQRAGDEGETTTIINFLANALFWGPTPVIEGIERCRTILEQAQTRPMAEANAVCYLAGFEAMLGRFDEARALYRRGRTLFEDLGHTVALAAHTLLSGTVEMLAGDHAAAERELRGGYEILKEMGETGVLSSSAAFLAEAVAAQGRVDEAERLTEVSRENASTEDVASQIGWRLTRAKVSAARGELDAAEDLAREGVALAEGTDFLNMHGDALLTLGDVLQSAARAKEATACVRDAAELYERKGNVVSAAKARARLAPT